MTKIKRRWGSPDEYHAFCVEHGIWGDKAIALKDEIDKQNAKKDIPTPRIKSTDLAELEAYEQDMEKNDL